MANRDNQVPENVPGRFYVDDECIHCGICVDTSPQNFKFNDEDIYAFVYKQPINDSENAKCMAALKACPVNAIGN